jgi:hypothetical protein
MNEKLPLLIKDKIFHYHEEIEKKSKKEKIRRKIRSYNAIISGETDRRLENFAMNICLIISATLLSIPAITFLYLGNCYETDGIINNFSINLTKNYNNQTDYDPNSIYGGKYNTRLWLKVEYNYTIENITYEKIEISDGIYKYEITAIEWMKYYIKKYKIGGNIVVYYDKNKLSEGQIGGCPSFYVDAKTKRSVVIPCLSGTVLFMIISIILLIQERIKRNKYEKCKSRIKDLTRSNYSEV